MTTVEQVRFPLIAVCSSAGGVDATAEILELLPAEFPGAVIVAQHRSPEGRSHLPEVLGRRTAMVVHRAQNGDVLQPGHVHVVPEAKHMLVGAGDRVTLIDVEGHPPARPSADLLLSTMAVSVGSRAIAVVLSGGGHDGALGAQAITAFGGHVLAQDAESAQAHGMPSAVISLDRPAAVLPPREIAKWLLETTATGRPAS
jgi:two-component system, chemotaxis family, protein-glutamate methylesterase/glutaminase